MSGPGRVKAVEHGGERLRGQPLRPDLRGEEEIHVYLLVVYVYVIERKPLMKILDEGEDNKGFCQVSGAHLPLIGIRGERRVDGLDKPDPVEV